MKIMQTTQKDYKNILIVIKIKYPLKWEFMCVESKSTIQYIKNPKRFAQNYYFVK